MEIQKPSFKERAKNAWEYTKDVAAVGTAGAVLGVGISATLILFGLGATAGMNGLERLSGAQEKHNRATLVNKSTIKLHTGSFIYHGDFVTSEGDTLHLYDNADIFYGKLMPNSNLPDAELGREYDVTSLQGPASSKLLDLE